MVLRRRWCFMLLTLAACSAAPTEEESVDDEGALETTAKQPVLKIPYWVGVPKKNVVPLPKVTLGTSVAVWQGSHENEGAAESAPIGLRLVVAPTAAEGARHLGGGAGGLAQPGDLVLPMNVPLVFSLPLVHVMMALMGELRVVTGATSEAPAPGTAAAYHVVRPRADGPAVAAWAGRFKASGRSWDAAAPSPQTITRMAQAALKEPVTAPSAVVAFSALALASCSVADIEAAPAEAAAPCVRPPFATSLTGVEAPGGFADGPLLAAMSASPTRPIDVTFIRYGRNAMVDTAGARALWDVVAADDQRFANLTSLLRRTQAEWLRGAKPPPEFPAQINEAVGAKVVSTSFLVEALKASSTRKIDYLGTVIVGSKEQVDGARALAKTPAGAP